MSKAIWVGVDRGIPIVVACHNCKRQTETPFDVGLPGVRFCEQCATGYYHHAIMRKYGAWALNQVLDSKDE